MRAADACTSRPTCATAAVAAASVAGAASLCSTAVSDGAPTSAGRGARALGMANVNASSRGVSAARRSPADATMPRSVEA